MPRPVDSSDLERLGGNLRQEMSAMGGNLRLEMRSMGEEIRTDLRQEIQAMGEQVRSELRQEIQSSVAVVLARIDASAAETRRYMGVVAEDLRSDIKAVAEGVGALDEKVERFRGEVHHEFGKVDRRMLHLEVRVIGRTDRT